MLYFVFRTRYLSILSEGGTYGTDNAVQEKAKKEAEEATSEYRKKHEEKRT